MITKVWADPENVHILESKFSKVQGEYTCLCGEVIPPLFFGKKKYPADTHPNTPPHTSDDYEDRDGEYQKVVAPKITCEKCRQIHMERTIGGYNRYLAGKKVHAPILGGDFLGREVYACGLVKASRDRYTDDSIDCKKCLAYIAKDEFGG